MEDGPRRIVSIAPSCTRIVRELGLGHRLVGVTRFCEAPEGYSGAIVGGWTDADPSAVLALEPDVVLACDDLQLPIVERLLAAEANVVHECPRTLWGVLDSIVAIGRGLDRKVEAKALAASMQDVIDSVARPAHPVRVYTEEWPDPPTTGGNWVPEMVEAAGGLTPLAEAGERSRPVTDEEIRAAEPDVVVLHYCGAEKRDPAPFVKRAGVKGLEAVVKGEVHCLDDRLLNEPSPALVDGVRQLAAVLRRAAGETPRAQA